MQLNLNHLYYFYVVAQEGSISRAAKKLFVTQPTISFQIKVFEDQLGFKLFKRVGTSIMITERGETLRKKAEQIFHISTEILNTLRSPEPESLKIGFPYDLPKSKVWKFLTQIKTALQNRCLECITGSEDQLEERFKTGKLQACLGYAEMPSRDAGVFCLGEIRYAIQAKNPSFNSMKDKNYVSFCQAQAVSNLVKDAGAICVLKSEDERLFPDLLDLFDDSFTILPQEGEQETKESVATTNCYLNYEKSLETELPEFIKVFCRNRK